MGLWNGIANGIGRKKSGIDWNSYWTTQIEAKAFGDAAGITDETQQRALATLVSDLKAINAIQAGFVDFATPANSICKAIYPFVGGTAAAHKFNLIDPVDADGSFRIHFTNGATTHDEKGITGNGANSTASTHLFPADLGDYDHGMEIFANGGAYAATGYWMGNDWAPRLALRSGQAYSCGKYALDDRFNQYSSAGCISLNRLSATAADFVAFHSGIRTVSGTAATAVSINTEITIMSLLGAAGTANPISYVAIRKAGVSEAVCLLHIAAILKFENNLGRLPKKNIVFEGHSWFDQQPLTNYTDWFAEQTVLKLNAVYANRTYRYVRSALGGSVISQMVTRKATAVDPFYISGYGMKNILPICIGLIEIYLGTLTGAQTYAALKAYYNSAVADGWIPILMTIPELYAGTNPNEAERVAFNNALKADADIDYILDLDALPEMADSTDLTYMQADQHHLTGARNQVCSTALAALIATIV